MKKSIIILLCIVTGLIGLFMSACGGLSLVFFGSLPVLLISLPSMLVGIVGVRAALRGFAAVRRNASEDTAQGLSVALCVMLTVIGLFVVSAVGASLFSKSLSHPVPDTVFIWSVFVPGLVVLVAGLAGIAYAIHARRRRGRTISGIQGTQSTTDPSAASRREGP